MREGATQAGTNFRWGRAYWLDSWLDSRATQNLIHEGEALKKKPCVSTSLRREITCGEAKCVQMMRTHRYSSPTCFASVRHERWELWSGVMTMIDDHYNIVCQLSVLPGRLHQWRVGRRIEGCFCSCTLD